MELDKFENLRSKAIQNGAKQTGLNAVLWDISNNCENPVSSSYRGKKPALDRVLKQSVSLMKYDITYHLDMVLPCRKCSTCLKARAKLWRARAYYEIIHSTRTWFCTFTLSPDNRYKFMLKAIATGRQKSVNFDKSTIDKQFGAIHNAIQREFTLYFKRIRKNSGAKLRYILVAEQHKDGFPHYHAFIHEQNKPVTKAILEENWHLGFTNFKLTDEHTVGYVTKYLSKSFLARVRASMKYGRPQDIAKRIDEVRESEALQRPINIIF